MSQTKAMPNTHLVQFYNLTDLANDLQLPVGEVCEAMIEFADVSFGDASYTLIPMGTFRSALEEWIEDSNGDFEGAKEVQDRIYTYNGSMLVNLEG